jgi:hypothetical protein
MKKTILAVALLIPSLALAQSEPVFHMQPEPDFNMALNNAMIPMKPKDAFFGLANCSIVDAKTLRAYTLPEAVKLLKPCLSDVSARYAVSLKGERGVVGTIHNGRGAILGIVIVAGTTNKVGNSMVRDINYSLSLRNGRLLGFKTVIRSQTDLNPAVPSLAQEAIDRCMLPTVVRQVENGADFIKFYGGCLRQDAALKIEDLKPWAGHQLGVMILTDAEGPAAEGLNGTVTVNAGKGPVTLDLVAYPKNLQLP